MTIYYLIVLQALSGQLLGVNSNPLEPLTMHEIATKSISVIEIPTALIVPSPPVSSTLPSPILVAKSSNDSSNINDTIGTLTRLWDFVGCSDGEKIAIKDALSEAHTILLSPGTSDMDKHWSDYAAVEFLGAPNTLYNFRDKIKQTFSNALNFQDSWFDPQDTQIFCHDNTMSKGDCDKSPGYIVVCRGCAPNNGLALAFCDRWFDLGTLGAVYDNTAGGSNKWDVSFYENRARPWITAMMLIRSIATWPGAAMSYRKFPFPTDQSIFFFSDYATGAAQVKWLAKLFADVSKTSWIVSNPDNWAWYALASYTQDKLGDFPHRPLVPKNLPSMGYVPPTTSQGILANSSTTTDISESIFGNSTIVQVMGVDQSLSFQQQWDQLRANMVVDSELAALNTTLWQ